MLVSLFIPFLILASPPVYDSEAAYNKTNSASKETRRRSQISRTTKNRKSQVSRQSKAKRTVKRRRGNIRKTNRRLQNQKYRLQRRRKAGGTLNRRKNSRATTYNNKQVNKRSTNRVRKTQGLRQHQPPIKKKSKSSKGKRSAQSPVHLSPIQKQMLMLQMEVLLRDPEMGHIYRQIINNKK